MFGIKNLRFLLLDKEEYPESALWRIGGRRCIYRYPPSFYWRQATCLPIIILIELIPLVNNLFLVTDGLVGFI